MRGEGEALDLVIVGGGPVGLVAGLAAQGAGLRFVVLERGVGGGEGEGGGRAPHTRAIGIHPPALRALEGVAGGPEIVATLVKEGVRVRRGGGFAGAERPLGTLDFSLLPPPHDFVLTLPQYRTEAILREGLEGVAPGALLTGVQVEGVGWEAPGEGADAGEGGPTSRPGDAAGARAPRTTSRLPFEAPRAPAPGSPAPRGRAQPRAIVRQVGGDPGDGRTFRAPFLLACDGKWSRVREALGISFPGGTYPRHFVMGDFPAGGAEGAGGEEADAGTDGEAWIWLHPRGLVESFPLGEEGTALRRWVVEMEGEKGGAGPLKPLAALVEGVRARCGVTLDPVEARRHSVFRAERREAAECWDRGVLLVGDAAHLVSPIGGQGMNLGWLNAVDAVAQLAAVLAGGTPEAVAASRYRRRSGRRARAVARRAEQNMWLACRGPLHPLRVAVVRGILGGPAWLRRRVARRFTMFGV